MNGSVDNLRVRVGLTTDALAPVDGPQFTDFSTAVTLADAFRLTAASAATAASTAQVSTQFRTLATQGGVVAAGIQTVGNYQLELTPGALNRNLTNTAVIATDANNAVLTFNTSVAGFAGLDLVSLATTPVATLAAPTGSAALVAVSEAQVADLFAGARALSIRDIAAPAAGNVAIEAQSFSGNIAVNFDAGLGLVAQTITLPMGSIGRDGVTASIPWYATGTQSAATGSVGIVRISNTGTVAAPVFGRVEVSSTGTPVTPGNFVSLGSVPARGELLLTGTTLEAALGNFGRGDVTVTVEAVPAAIAIRRIIQVPGGPTYQLDVATNATR